MTGRIDTVETSGGGAKPLATVVALGVALTMAALGLAGCYGGTTVTVGADEVGWRTYTNRKLGYSVSHPDALEPQEHGAEVLFRGAGPLGLHLPFVGGVPALVRWEGEAEGRRRGAWFGTEPAGPITLDGVAGLKYVYVHHDGPSPAPTIAYVVPFRGKFLALEFRSDGDIDRVQQRMLDSFRLGGPG